VAGGGSLLRLVRVLEQIEPPARVAVRSSPPALELHPAVVPDRNSEGRGSEDEPITSRTTTTRTANFREAGIAIG